MRRLLALATAVLGLVLAAPAGAEEKLLTLYSPRIDSQPYVHDVHEVTLRPNGREAPNVPGYITGFQEQVLVDSKDPRARPLPNSKMMIHHLLYYAKGTVDQLPGSCWGEGGFINGRGEEHPTGRFGRWYTPAMRRTYGTTNRTADGRAPTWSITAMVMNHYKRPKSFWIRTRIWYTTEKRIPMMPVIVGNCRQLGNGMAYDVPGGGRPGSNYVDKTTWTVPKGLNGRIIGGASHQHGGGKYQTLDSLTCDRRIFRAPVYYGTPDHIYNTIRPILHEPGPVGTGVFRSVTGIPITEGEVLTRQAVHDGHNLHVAAMGFWILMVARDDSVKRCGAMPRDVEEVNRPRRFDRTPNYGLVVPQLAHPAGRLFGVGTRALTVSDDVFEPQRIVARRNQRITWRFTGRRPHSVTVANGPRGFSSVYWGQRASRYSFTPRVRGTYRLTCLVHPTYMAQTLVVR